MSGLALLLAAMLVQEPAAAPAAPPPLVAVAGAARYRLSASSDLLLEYLDEDSRAAFARGLRVDRERPLGLLWSQLMAGAVQVRRETGDGAETLWFNPALDVGILTRWARGPSGWRATAVAPVLGERLRGEPVTDVVTPRWVARGGDLAEALEATGDATFAAAEREPWAPLFDPGQADVMTAVGRLMFARGAIRQMEAAPGFGLSVATLRRELSGASETSTLPAPVTASLVALGATARRTLRPVIALRHPEGWTLVLQSPDAPALSWLVHFADPAPGTSTQPQAFGLAMLGRNQEAGQ
jgi:hypothetical protein